MEFTCKTIYDQKSLTVLSRALRMTIRRKNSRRTRTIAWVAIAIELECLLMSLRIPWLAAGNGLVALLLLLLLWKEDAFNAFFARRKIVPWARECVSVFYPECYEARIAGVVTQWQYSRVLLLAESDKYFILILGKDYAQAYDKKRLSGGTEESFRRFLEEKTGKAIQKIEGQPG